MRKASENSEALAAFVAHKTEIDAILARLTRLSNDHFNATPDEINWGDVGTLSSYLEQMQSVAAAAFHEGEYAD